MDQLDGFEKYLREHKQLSDNTVQSYRKDTQNYIAYLSSCSIGNPTLADAQVIHQYLTYLEEKGRTASTITRNVASIRCYYQYLCLNERAGSNPALEVKREKIVRKLPSILTGDELELLLSQPDVREPKGCRDKAMMELLYATGIRVSELISLNVGDINLREGMLSCKGSKNSRRIPIYPVAVTAVSDYLFRVRGVVMDQRPCDKGQALFVNLNGRRLSRQGFWKIIKGYAASASITKEITPHTLRHSFALHLLENGAQLRDIQAMLGHVDISSTQLYVHILDHSDQETYYQYHPKAKRDE